MAVTVVWMESRGCWWLVDRRNGKRQVHSFHPRKYAGDKEAARVAAQQVADALTVERRAQQARKQSIELGANGGPIYGEAAMRRWWELKSGATSKKHGRNTLYYLERFLIPRFGKSNLRTLTTLEIANFGGEMAEMPKLRGIGKLSIDTVQNTVSTLRTILNWLADPALGLNYQPPRGICAEAKRAARVRGATEGEAEPFNRAEVQHLLQLAESTPLYPLLFAALHTGMRKGELLGLDWSNVDLTAEKPHIKVRDVLLEDGEIRESPKTDRSRRRVWLSPELTELLRRMQKDRARVTTLRGETAGRVFRSSTGEPWSYSGFDSSWRRLRSRAFARFGVRELDLHSFRHTYITWAIEAGVSKGRVAEQVGDSEETIMGVYKHVDPDSTIDHSFLSVRGTASPQPPALLRAVDDAG